MLDKEIDINRPQDYMFANVPDAQIIDFSINENAPTNDNQRIIVTYLKNHACSNTTVGIKGEFFIGQKSSWDVILKPEVAAKQAEKPQEEIKKRKVVQISSAINSDGDEHVWALCNDGKIFMNFDRRDEWKELPPIPQD